MPDLNPQDDTAKLIALCRAVIKSNTDKVAAILVLRKRCGLGLREAKTWVEDHYDAIFRDPSMSTTKNIATSLKGIRTRHDAGKEGWDIFETSNGSLEIQAIIDAGGPQDDVEATEYVIEAAKGGNVDALRALVVLLAHIAEPVIEEAIRLQAGMPTRLEPFVVTIPEPACVTASMACT